MAGLFPPEVMTLPQFRSAPYYGAILVKKTQILPILQGITFRCKADLPSRDDFTSSDPVLQSTCSRCIKGPAGRFSS